MLFCKNSGETPSARCGGISTTMSDKSISSEAVAATSAETPQGPSAALKIYPIVKYGDPVLEKPGAPVKKFDAGLEQLTEDMFASMYAAKGETFEIRGENLLARAFCHEIDHLNGILFLQHLSMLKRDLIKRKIKKLRKQGEW